MDVYSTKWLCLKLFSQLCMSALNFKLRLLRRQFHHIDLETTFICVTEIKAEHPADEAQITSKRPISLKRSIAPAEPKICPQLADETQWHYWALKRSQKMSFQQTLEQSALLGKQRLLLGPHSIHFDLLLF